MGFFKYILLIFLSTSLYAQKLHRSPYTDYVARMEAKAIREFNMCLERSEKANDRTLGLYHTDWLKVTLKTRFNKNVMQKVDLVDGVGRMLDGVETNDYLSLAAYNLRVKVYLNKRFRLVGNWLITGVNTNTYYYTCGLLIKFK